MTEPLPPEDPRDALIRELTARVSELTAQVAELREQLGAARRAASRNSGNSSLPPSGDDQPRRQPRRKRRAAERAEKKRSRGKQPGSPGAAMRCRKPDETLDHYPQGALIRAWHAAREQGLPAVPAEIREPLSWSSAAPSRSACPRCPASPARRPP